MTYEPSPLAHVAHLSALKDMVRTPDPASLLHAATTIARHGVKLGDGEKEAFDVTQLLVGTVLGRHATQSEAARWLLAFALADVDRFRAFIAHARAETDRAKRAGS